MPRLALLSTKETKRITSQRASRDSPARRFSLVKIQQPKIRIENATSDTGFKCFQGASTLLGLTSLNPESNISIAFDTLLRDKTGRRVLTCTRWLPQEGEIATFKSVHTQWDQHPGSTAWMNATINWHGHLPQHLSPVRHDVHPRGEGIVARRRRADEDIDVDEVSQPYVAVVGGRPGREPYIPQARPILSIYQSAPIVSSYKIHSEYGAKDIGSRVCFNIECSCSQAFSLQLENNLA
ncbi:hypothetical protein C8Q72DRAFT_944886 [Fomitopsis betulina]|nr:hypothetical protein C8Q72DRAFT_944886 [Fomitopsis betulina]